MALPLSFARDGFVPLAATKYKRLLIGTEGMTDTGKSEFALSAPGPGIMLVLDRMIDGMLDNPNPPKTRRSDYAHVVVKCPLVGTEKQEAYVEYWNLFRSTFYKALANPDCRTVIIDGDSDSWELQRLAEFGKLQQVPSILYTAVNASRRAMIARAWDSGKIVIATNKIKDVYIDEINPNTGEVVKGNDGKPRRVKSGEQDRQGFSDTDYLWHIQLKHLYRPARLNTVSGTVMPAAWGVRILKCKANTQLVGDELWGDECNFQTLVQLVYPQVPMKSWGY